MALRWTGAAMLEAANGLRRLEAHKQLPILRRARATHQAKHASTPTLNRKPRPPSPINQRSRPCQFQPGTGHPLPIRVTRNFCNARRPTITLEI
jgi:hypothetical protein